MLSLNVSRSSWPCLLNALPEQVNNRSLAKKPHDNGYSVDIDTSLQVSRPLESLIVESSDYVCFLTKANKTNTNKVQGQQLHINQPAAIRRGYYSAWGAETINWPLAQS